MLSQFKETLIIYIYNDESDSKYKQFKVVKITVIVTRLNKEKMFSFLATAFIKYQFSYIFYCKSKIIFVDG